MTSLGTDFETHVNWQGYVEEPTAKGFVARKACTIALREAGGIHWNKIKCKEQLGNHPETVVGQAMIYLDSQVWKSLEDSLPKLFCIDLAEAYCSNIVRALPRKGLKEHQQKEGSSCKKNS
jgi:hypothetical protein